MSRVNYKQAIFDAVWEGEINQVTTREVAERFGCSLKTARHALQCVVCEWSGDARFEVIEPFLSVKVKDGKTFTYNAVNMQGNPASLDKSPPIHYIWFLT
jgi:hypothetical protein